MMVGTYSGNLIAFLASPVLPPTVDSLQEFAEDSSLVGVVVRDTAIHDSLEVGQCLYH